MKFAYQAYEKSGARRNDVIEASDPTEATEQLRRQGLLVTELRRAGAPTATAPAAGPARRGPSTRRLREVGLFSRQLHLLVSTGTPLTEGLASLERQAVDPAWKSILVDVRRRVEEGATLNEALAAHPRSFDRIFCGLVAAGEATGELDVMLERLGKMTRRAVRTRNEVASALLYPVLLIALAIGLVIAMVTVVLPRFAGLYETLDVPLPTSTMMLMEVSDLLRTWWWLILGLSIPAVVGAVLWLRTSTGRRALDRALVRAPGLGRLVRGFALARVGRVLGDLVQSRVPLLEALEMAREAAGNSAFVELLARAEESVARGEPISLALSDAHLVPPYVVEALRNGERSGQLGPLMCSIADALDEDNDVAIRTLSSLLEPVILLVLGSIVAFMALGLFLPLFDLTSMTG